jgi:hypothetical protein
MRGLITQYGGRLIVPVIMLLAGLHFGGVLLLCLALMGALSFAVAVRWGAIIGAVTAGAILALMLMVRMIGF